MDLAETDPALIERLDMAALQGMQLAVWADLQPDTVCVHDPDGAAHSFATVNANANRLVRLLRARGWRRATASRWSAPTASSSSRCWPPPYAGGSG